MAKENDIKRIPYGIADFNLFRSDNYYYVDKTRFIRDIENKGRYLFFIRPRRFGKSLLLSLLESYYDIDKKNQFDGLFTGTDIHRDPTGEQNTYLILSLNFSKMSSPVSEIEENFTRHVKNAVTYFTRKYAGMLEQDIEEALALIGNQKNVSAVMDTFLYTWMGKKPKIYVIIDEYDNFANTILAESGEDYYRAITHGEGFLRSFFNVLKGGTTGSDAPISRMFVTGVSPITMDDVTSGFNIGTNISLDSDMVDLLGFTQTEVEAMIDYYRQTGKILHSTSELIAIMSQWYNHYRFSMDSDVDVFNTIHALYFLREYMKASKIPRIFVDENILTDYKKIRQLIIIDKKGEPSTNGSFTQLQQIIETGVIHSKVTRSFPVRDIAEPENFVSLLYYFGLLTIGGSDELNRAILKIPNESVKRLYITFIRKTYEETGVFSVKSNDYDTFMEAMAVRGEWKPLIEFLVKKMDASMGLRDLMSGEKSVQAFLNILFGLSDLYMTHSEKELNKGFADLVLEPFLTQYPAIKYSYLIEIKYIPLSKSKKKSVSQKQIHELAMEAGLQLDQYSRDEKFRKSIGQTTLKKLVLIFCGSQLVYYNEV
ncbi:MAG: AAA family ATPase [Candidatus Omnitrophota bacterium]